VKGAIARKIPMAATLSPAGQRIKQKKCRSSWSIGLQILEIYSVVLGSYLGIDSRGFGNIQNYLTIPGKLGNFSRFG
jgi:hypothetical protein